MTLGSAIFTTAGGEGQSGEGINSSSEEWWGQFSLGLILGASCIATKSHAAAGVSVVHGSYYH